MFSIAVVTYNQKDLIEETLNSILTQGNLKKIELVISDDASEDGTQETVESWLERYENKFFKVKFIKSQINRGISGHVKSALENVESPFVKVLAGDDILKPGAINNMEKFLESNDDILFATALGEKFIVKERSYKVVGLVPEKRYWRILRSGDWRGQFRAFAKGCFVPGAVVFFRMKFFEKYGFPEEKYKWFEDWYMYLRALSKGERIFFLEKKLFKIRKHLGSISTSTLLLGKINIFRDNLEVYKKFSLFNIELLKMVDVISIYSRCKYLSKLIELGGDLKAHRVARKYKLLDTFWWKDLWRYPVDKINSLRFLNLLRKEKELL